MLTRTFGLHRAFPWRARLAALCLFAAPAGAVAASGDGGESGPSPGWGVALGYRYADVPFVAADESVTDVMPLLYYEGERFFLEGLAGGLRIAHGGSWRLSVYTRYRFFDVPRRLQNESREDAWDIGLELRHALPRDWEMRWQLLGDKEGAAYLDAGIETRIGDDFAWWRPSFGLRAKSDNFNDRYYGLGEEAIGGGVNVWARIEARRHLWRNLYLIGGFGATYLDPDVRRSGLIEDDVAWEAFFGIGAFDRPDAPARPARPDGYWRIAHGWATYSNLGDIVRGNFERDPDDNRLTSLFYGHALADELFGLPLKVYLTGGLVAHHRSDVQRRSAEYVIAFKAYYTFPWPVRVRLGLAEGVSYVSQVPYVERTELGAKGYQASKFLNYLDLSVDTNAGDLFGVPALRRLWIGYGIHHRSGVFEAGSQFGRVSGGSNYHTLYLQWER